MAKRKTTTTTNNGVHTFLLLDRTGSMNVRWEETLSAINAYVGGIGKAAKITVAVFDDYLGSNYQIIRNGVTREEWKPITSEDALPRGSTPLYDAIGKIVTTAEKVNAPRTVIVVMTDGLENSSREYDREAAKAALDRCRQRDWQVVMLGADFDAFEQASRVGTAAGQTLNVNSGNYAATMRRVARHTQVYGATGQSVSFTDEDRWEASGTAPANDGAAAGEKWDGDPAA